MTTFLISLIPASLFIYGVHILFQEGHLFESAGEWITNRLGETWSKPIINCPICQSSVWGTLWFFVGLPFGFDVRHQILLWPVYCLCLCGWHVILSKLTSKERILVDE